MKIRIICLIILGFTAAGCCCSTGQQRFVNEEERLTNLGESIENIALDGDGVN